MKNKFVFITLFLVLFAFIIGTNSFASTSNLAFFYNGAYHYIPNELLDKFSYFYVIKIDDTYTFFATNNYLGIQNYGSNSNNNMFRIIGGSGGGEQYSSSHVTHAISSSTDIDTCLNNYRIDTNNSTSSIPNGSKFGDNMTLISSNASIYPWDSSNGLDLENPIITSSSGSSGSYSSGQSSSSNISITSNKLSEIFNSSNLSGVLQEIISLLPIIIPVLIGFIAIRKGLSFIFRTLRNS